MAARFCVLPCQCVDLARRRSGERPVFAAAQLHAQTGQQFTGLAGKFVTLEEALDGCERILNDEFKDYPESAMYMIGSIDEAEKKRNEKSAT